MMLLDLHNNQPETMMANKLQEMKKKLLLQTQLKKENNDGATSPRLGEEAPVTQVVPTTEIVQESNKSKQIDEEQEHDQSPEESNSPQKQQGECNEIEQEQKPSMEGNACILSQKQEVRVEQEYEQEVQQKGQNIEKNLQNQIQLLEKAVDNHQNLDLSKDQNPFVSVDQEVKQVINQKINQLQKEITPEELKAEKKTKKIVLKELLKVKQCIKNLQSALIGLEHIQKKIKHYPSLKGKLATYLRQLKELNK